MSRSQSFNTLTELAQTHVDLAGQELRRIQQERRIAQRQLDTLKSYQEDYRYNLAKHFGIGLSVSNYQNVQRFITSLDTVIANQNTVLARMNEYLSAAYNRWFELQGRLRAYQALHARKLRQQRHDDDRAERRLNDETSIGMHHRRRSLFY
ncbi:flagellar export protein FliJ [Allopusillimonas ginsengisoli]|uniref:flagellar export protein FliJ n=1 Tax=Allopusillimonas ginsengisoli TaxID=453575 RepID=UPI00101FCDB7|nr:flagellar export protein FliJ [Allopusillimonas ginsengisoli]TEA79398.1 flagellar export protein FliJ [Allopusillimonas ginsengisoli]